LDSVSVVRQQSVIAGLGPPIHALLYAIEAVNARHEGRE
jgi:hypothetical protein